MKQPHEHITPTSLTRLLSVGRQFIRLAKEPVKINPVCHAARALGTDTVEIYSIGILEGDFIFYARPHPDVQVPKSHYRPHAYALVYQGDLV